MYRTALLILTVLCSSPALPDSDTCQKIADAYAVDSELKQYAVPLRTPAAEEIASWSDYECKSFPTALKGYYEHAALSMRLLSTDIQTGMHVSYTEILKAPPDCNSRDGKVRYGDALFNFNKHSGSSTKLLVIEGTPIFVIGGFGESRFAEGLTEAISIPDGSPQKLCSFKRVGESILSSTGDSMVCTDFSDKEYEFGEIERTGKFYTESVDGPGRIIFMRGAATQLTMEIDYTSVSSRYRVSVVRLESSAIIESTLRQWEQILTKKIGFHGSGKIPEWIMMKGRPTAVEKWPMETWITWPDTEAKRCEIKLLPRYKPAEPLPDGGARLGEAIGP